MLQETVYKRTRVGLLRKGFYYIRTTRAVWERVQVVSRSGRVVRIFYIVMKRYRKRGGKLRIKYQRCVEDLPIHSITEARRYCM